MSYLWTYKCFAICWHIADVGQTDMILYIDGPDAGIDFQVDSLSITEISQWNGNVARNSETGPIIATIPNCSVNVQQTTQRIGRHSAVQEY